MKILMISPQIPYPYIGGAKMVTYNTIKYLSKNKIDITLLALGRNDGESSNALKKYCNLKIVPFKTNNNYLKIIMNIFSTKPYFISKYFSQRLIKKIDFILKNNDIQLVHIERLHMAYCAKHIKANYSLPIVFRPHNVESSILYGYLKYTKNFFIKKFLKIQYARLYRYEKEIIKYFDKCLAISKIDKNEMIKMNTDLDCMVINPGINILKSPKKNIMSDNILFVGSLDWKPNEDSLLWFVDKVFPLIKEEIDINFVIVGQNPSKKIKSLNFIDGIEVKGFVDDLGEYYSDASVSIVPLQYGGGVKIKIIESLLMKVPLIATEVSVDGIDCINQKHLLIAKSEDEFVKAIMFFLKNKDRANEIVENGYEFAKKEYDPVKVAKKYINVYDDLIGI